VRDTADASKDGAGERAHNRGMKTRSLIPQRADPYVYLHGDGYYAAGRVFQLVTQPSDASEQRRANLARAPRA
jgi:GH43 family beta-xylosidase